MFSLRFWETGNPYNFQITSDYLYLHIVLLEIKFKMREMKTLLGFVRISANAAGLASSKLLEKVISREKH